MSGRSPGNRRARLVLALWIGALMIGATGLAAVRADEEEGELRGAITVDVAGSSATVAGTVLVVTEDTRLKVGDAAATLAEMATYVIAHPDAEAEAEYRVEMGVKVADKIKIEDEDGEEEDELELKGVLTADAGNSTVTVGGVVLLVDANTDIEAGGDHVALAELVDYLTANPGTRGEAKYAVVGSDRVATKVETKGDSEDDGDDDDEDEEELVGVLAADASAGTVSVGAVTFQTTLGTEFKLNRRNVTLAVLAAFLTQNPGTLGKVEYRVLEGLLIAREVKVIGAAATPGPVAEVEVTGVIQSLHTRTGALEFLTDAAATLALTLDAATEIEVDDANMTLAELASLLAPGLEVRARLHYDPDTLVVRELDATIPVTQQQATLSSANVRTGSLTVRVPNPNRPGRFLVKRALVLRGATVLRGNAVVRLADLRRGQTITLSTFTSRRRNIAPEVTINP